MIKVIDRNDIPECVTVIKESFMTVADELGFTAENAPRFTAFAISDDVIYPAAIWKRNCDLNIREMLT